MSVTLSLGATTVDLQHGPEWGGEASIEPALIWEPMCDGRWRRWDRGIARDVWACQHTWRVMAQDAAALRDLLHAVARGQTLTLVAEEGIDPFGPLVDCSAGIQVRASAAQDLSMLPVTRDWMVQLSLVVDPHPQTQGKWITDASSDGLAVFLDRADASPVQEPTWGLVRSETAFLQSSRNGDLFQASLSSILRGADFRSALHAIVVGRGPVVSIPAARYPWGPGIAPNDPSGHLARIKAVSWSRIAPDLYSFSATAVREFPT